MTQLLSYFLLYFLIYLLMDYKWLQNFTEYPKRLSLGFTINQKKLRERVEGLNPFWTGWRLRKFWACLGSTSPSPVQNLSQTSKLYLLEITENSKNLLEKVSPKKSLYYSENLSENMTKIWSLEGWKLSFQPPKWC